jgi:hypothetical protein
MIIKTTFYTFNVLNAQISKENYFIMYLSSASGVLFNIFLISFIKLKFETLVNRSKLNFIRTFSNFKYKKKK